MKDLRILDNKTSKSRGELGVELYTQSGYGDITYLEINQLHILGD